MNRRMLIVAAVLSLTLAACNSPGKKEEKACSNVVKLLFKEKSELAKKAFGDQKKGLKLCAAAGKTVGEMVGCVLTNDKADELEKCAKASAMGFVGAQGEDLTKLLVLARDKDLMGLLGPATMMIAGRREKRDRGQRKHSVEPMTKPTNYPSPVVKTNRPPAKSDNISITIKDRTVTVDKVFAAWSDDWTLHVFALSKCPQFSCELINRWGSLKDKELKAVCPEYGNFGVELKSHWGIRMRPGVWYFRKTDNEPVEARPYVQEPSRKKWHWFGKGGTIQITSLSDKIVGVNANFSDNGGNIYRGSYTATICPRANRPKALVVTELMPPPHKPLLPKAQLLQMKPAVPAEFVAEFAFEPSWARDGRISWYLKHKVSHQTVLTMTIEDKRNELYTRRERSKRLFGKYPMVRYDNGWMWTYVGNFNIDVSTTGYNDPRVKSNAVLEKVFKSLPLSQFEKL